MRTLIFIALLSFSSLSFTATVLFDCEGKDVYLEEYIAGMAYLNIPSDRLKAKYIGRDDKSSEEGVHSKLKFYTPLTSRKAELILYLDKTVKVITDNRVLNCQYSDSNGV